MEEATEVVRSREFRPRAPETFGDYGGLTDQATVCPEHALLLQQRSAASPMLVMLQHHERASALITQNAEKPGSLAADEIAMLDQYASACRDFAIAAEVRQDAEWQAGAAEAERLATTIDALVRTYLSS